MKQQDFAIIFVVAVVSAVLSITLSGIFFSTPEDRSQKVEVVEPISTTFQTPDARYFNSDSFNPAQSVNTDTDKNSNPFGSQ